MKEETTGHYVWGILGNLIAIALVNTLLLWRQYTRGVVLESWVEILWASNLSLIVQMLGNLLLAFYRPPRFVALVRTLFAAASLTSIIVFFLVFPLDFSRLVGTWLNTLLKVLLAVGMGASLISGTVHLVRFIAGPRPKEERAG